MMANERYWLINAEFAEDTVQLTFLRTPEGTLEVIQDQYTPFFFALPTNLGEVVHRKDIMKNQLLEVAKIPLKSKIEVEREWEREIDPAMSYVHDHRLRFGCPHVRTSKEMKLDLPLTKSQSKAFNTQFGVLAQEDPLKYDFLQEYFHYAMQPIPRIPRDLLQINAKYDINRIYYALMLSRIANIPFLRALKSRGVSEWIRSMLHTSYRNLDILIPDPEELKKGHKPHRVEGALTIAPTPGVYFNMTVLDFESLYPSVIDRYNLSYETVDCEHDECCQNIVPDTNHYVCNQRRGVFSALIGALKDLRIRWFKPQSRRKEINPQERERAKAVSDLLKLLLVSSGGVTIRIQGLACPPLAESMMAYGRWALRSSWNYAIEHGLKPVYGDTDSLFLDNPSKQQVNWLILKVKDELDLILAVDVIYPLCIFSSAKKAYFGMLHEGTPDIKGITLGKSSTPPRFRRIFREAVKPLVGVDNAKKLEKAIPSILEVLKQQIALLKQRAFTVEEMEHRVKVWKAMKDRGKRGGLAQPYQALRQLTDKGIKIKRREEVGFVKVKPFRYGGRTFSVKPTNLAKKHEIDVPDYIRKLEMAFQQVLDPLQVAFPREPSIELDTFLSNTVHTPFTSGESDEEPGDQPEKPDPQKRLSDYSEE